MRSDHGQSLLYLSTALMEKHITPEIGQRDSHVDCGTIEETHRACIGSHLDTSLGLICPQLGHLSG